MPKPDEIKKKWEEGSKRRRSFDRDATMNIAALYGERAVRVDPVTRRVYKVVLDKDTLHYNIPLAKMFWRTLVAKGIKNNPIPEVLQMRESEEAKVAAKAGQAILDSELERLDFPLIYLRLWLWTSTIGTAHLHPHWNHDTNNIELGVVPHMEMVMDPSAKMFMSEARWAIHGTVLTKDAAFEKWGKKFKEDTISVPDVWKFIHSAGGHGGQKTGVLVLRYWGLPSRKYPEGEVKTIIGGEVVEESTFPYRHGKLPFVSFHDSLLPGRFEGSPIFKDLLDSNSDYNSSRSRQAEVRDLLAAPKWQAAIGSMEDDKITKEAGQIIKWRPTGPFQPGPINPPRVPPFIFQSQEDALREMADISGIHEVSQGVLPSSDIAASAISMLQEADDTKLGPVTLLHERGIAEVGKQLLQLVQQYWDQPRTVRIYEKAKNQYIFDAFEGQQLIEDFIVRVVPGSALPRSKAALEQKVISLWRERAIQDPDYVLEALDLPDRDKLLVSKNRDLEQAVRENKAFMEGEVPEAALFHDHLTHIDEHNDLRKTEEFEKADEGIRAAVADHVMQHELLKQEQLMKDLEEQATVQEAAAFAQTGQPSLGESSNGSEPSGPPSPIGAIPQTKRGGGLGGSPPIPPDLPGVKGD